MSKEAEQNIVLVARVVVEYGDSLLLLRRSQNYTRPGTWEIPGGRVDPGENFEEAARREVNEETGLEVLELSFIHSSSYEAEGTKRISVTFLAQADTTTVVLSDEHDTFEWTSINNLNNKEFEPYYDRLFSELYGDRGDMSDNDAVNTTKVNTFNQLIAYTDGGSRGNPGPSASGYVIMDQDKNILMEGGEYLGITTNNQAEYQAVKRALELCLEYGAKEVDFYIDSQLIVKQMSGEYKIKNRDLWPIHENIKQMAAELERVSFTHVYREDNKLADAKVNEVLDNHVGGRSKDA